MRSSDSEEDGSLCEVCKRNFSWPSSLAVGSAVKCSEIAHGRLISFWQAYKTTGGAWINGEKALSANLLIQSCYLYFYSAGFSLFSCSDIDYSLKTTTDRVVATGLINNQYFPEFSRGTIKNEAAHSVFNRNNAGQGWRGMATIKVRQCARLLEPGTVLV